MNKKISVITSKPHHFARITIMRREKKKRWVKNAWEIFYGRWELWVIFRNIAVREKREVIGWIQEFIRLNASPAYAYNAKVTWEGIARMKSREALDKSDRISEPDAT